MPNFVQIKDGNGALVNVEAEALNDGLGNTVYRQGVYIGEPNVFGPVAQVENTDPSQTDYGLIVRPLSSYSLVYHAISQGTVNAVSIKASPGLVLGYSLGNNALGVYPVFVKLFDKASPPIPGTDSPFMTLMVQAGTTRELALPRPVAVSFGLGIAITKFMPDSDSTAIAANDCCVDLYYL